jgi:hypothetical protein
MSNQIKKFKAEIENFKTSHTSPLLTFHCHNQYYEDFNWRDAYFSYDIKDFRSDYPKVREDVFKNFCVSFGEKYSELHENMYVNEWIYFKESEEELSYTFNEHLADFVKASKSNPTHIIQRTKKEQIDKNTELLKKFK